MKNWLPFMNNEFRHFPKWTWLRLFSFNYVRVIKDQMSICFKLLDAQAIQSTKV